MNSKNGNKKIVNIEDSRKSVSKQPAPQPKKHRLKPDVLAAVIFVVIFGYIVVNVFFYYTKERVSIYEVQGEDISTEKRFRGIALREESIVRSDYAGYINYYVQNGKRTTNNGVVYSVDESSFLYSQIKDNTGVEKLTADEIKQIKNLIYGYRAGYSQADFSGITEFQQEITDTIYEIVNDASIESMYSIRNEANSSSSFHVKTSSTAGIISYKTDDLCGYTFDRLTPEMFKDDFNPNTKNMKTTGLIAEGDNVYRIIPNEEWQIAVSIPEEVYLDMLEKTSVSFYINDYFQPLTGSLKTVQDGENYYAIISLDQYMSLFVDNRLVEIEFNEGNEGGLKIPLSAVTKKNFYLIPIDMFVLDEEHNRYVLYKEVYDNVSGETVHDPVYPQRYFSDGYYAYIDMSLLNEGDLLVNTETDERIHVSLVNSLEGVYNVNKGYYQFVRIEKIRQNSEYAIVKKNTSNGLRLYDHIALDANDALDQAIIY